MTTIYLIRHGESQANEQNLFIGHTDLALTELGRKQAQITADYLKNIKPDVIYSSDLQRAYCTAQATASLHNARIIKEPGLREIYAGSWEYVPFSKLQTERKATYDIWLNDVAHARCDDGESVAELGRRVVETVRNIVQKHKDQVIFIFSHATPIRTFALHAMGRSPDQLDLIPWPSNASVTKVEFEGGHFRLAEYSIDHFMGALATQLPDNV